MKLVTFGFWGERRVGALTNSGVVDLDLAYSRHGGEGSSQLFSKMETLLDGGSIGLKSAADLVDRVLKDETRMSCKPSCIIDPSKVAFKAPVRDAKIFCPAVNYQSHGTETGVKPPSAPYFFSKLPNSVIGNDEDVVVPNASKQADYEVELAAVIGRRGSDIDKKDVYEYIAGYTILNDISFRDLQHPIGWPAPSPLGQNWIKGKGMDTCCPIGPCIVTRDEITNPYPLKVSLKVNGQIKQDASTEDQIFKLPDLVSYISEGITLTPGDIISTGTPAGVAFPKGPFLQDGDMIEAIVEKIGTLRNRIRL